MGVTIGAIAGSIAAAGSAAAAGAGAGAAAIGSGLAAGAGAIGSGALGLGSALASGAAGLGASAFGIGVPGFGALGQLGGALASGGSLLGNALLGAAPGILKGAASQALSGAVTGSLGFAPGQPDVLTQGTGGSVLERALGSILGGASPIPTAGPGGFGGPLGGDGIGFPRPKGTLAEQLGRGAAAAAGGDEPLSTTDPSFFEKVDALLQPLGKTISEREERQLIERAVRAQDRPRSVPIQIPNPALEALLALAGQVGQPIGRGLNF